MSKPRGSTMLLGRMTGSADWLEEAACAELEDPDPIFFAVGGNQHVKRMENLAKRICASCSVLTECSADADAAEIDLPSSMWWGVVAGQSVNDRRRRRKKERLLNAWRREAVLR